MTKPIDLFASLRDVSRKTPGTRFAIQIKADTLLFDPNHKIVAQKMANAIAEQCRENLLHGKKPDGGAMPGIDADTQEQRDVLERRGRRGGQADPRYVDPDFKAQVKRNYDKQYRAKRGELAKKMFVPKAGGPRGVVSGLLAHSFLARPNADGRGFTVFVAAARATALPRVLGRIPLWSAQGNAQPKIQQAMKDAAEGMLSRSTQEMLAKSAELLSQVFELAEAVEDLGDE